MRMTVLIENAGREDRADLTAEFGLSLLFELDGARLLFDTGTSGAFADNAARMGVDLATVDLAVLSHHHFDHGGGLARFFEVNDHAPVYLRRADRAEREFRAFGILRRQIGLDPEIFDRFPDRLVELSETSEIRPGVTLLTEIAEDHPRPRGNRHLKVRRGGRLEPDPFDHELTMVLHDGDGMVVVTGCSHNGILNMVDAARRRFPELPLRAVIGGFHLIGVPLFNSMAASRRQVEEMGRAIAARCAGPIFTGHCTGQKAFAVLEGVLGEQLRAFPTGTVVEI